MKPIVVYLDPSDQGSACYVTAPFDIQNPHFVSFVILDEVFQLNGPDLVRKTGEKLAEKICENAAVQAALDLALAQAGPESLPICFRVGDDVAHGLSWEALVGNNSFLALSDRWPIARIARGGALEERPLRPWGEPLRLVCVLSATGVSAEDEWNAVHAAVTASRQKGLAVTVDVFSGEEELVTRINQLGEQGTTARPVLGPEAVPGLIQQIEELQPHLVHLFCHGTTTNGERRLEIATAGDFDRDDGTSSVLLYAEELGTALGRAGTWAVVLNSCKGAQTPDQLLTHAELLVNKGVPVAIGMRRQIDVSDAVAFSGAFWPEAFRTLAQARAKGHGEQAVSWADTLIRARQKLRDIHGADPALNDSWTMPILYSTPGGFTLVVSETHDEALVTQQIGEAGTVQGLVDVLTEGASAALLADLQSIAPAGLGE